MSRRTLSNRQLLRPIFFLLFLGGVLGCGGGSGDSFSAGDEVGKVCGGIQAALCSEGLYCQFPVNSCGARNTPGLCQILPEACTADVNPVCGCDGGLYSNACEAARNGQSIRPIGDCLD